MAQRKPTMNTSPSRLELEEKVFKAVKAGVSDEQLQAQRASFIFGNAPENSKITRESALSATQTSRLKTHLSKLG